MFNSPLTLTVCGLSDGKEVKDVFGRPGARVGVGSARLRPLVAHGVGCLAAGQNLETGQLSRHYIAEISLNVTLNHNHQILCLFAAIYGITCSNIWHNLQQYTA